MKVRNKMNEVLKKIHLIKPIDYIAPFVFLLLLVPSWIFRLINKIKNRELWLIAEEGEARDNGYYFYKYVRECHPDVFCFYAIKIASPDYEKVSKLGNTIRYGGLKHWLYYMSANLNISSQKSGNPCPIFWYFTHVVLGLYRNRVFLQHGITHNDSKWLYYNKTKFKYFVCGAKKEYDFVKEKFGYPDKNLLLIGFPRWDSLKDMSGNQKNKTILIMPTWRNWLFRLDQDDFRMTEYCKRWNGLINDKKFIECIEKNKIKVYFYSHINMKKHLSCFRSTSKNIEIISHDKNIQDYFNKCNMMITDYSSVAFDFAYLEKPIIYYQFDIDRYRKEQLQEGYFDYEGDGFGPVVKQKKEVIDKIRYYVEHDFQLTTNYKRQIHNFFMCNDNHNSNRIYRILKNRQDNLEKIKIMFVVNTMNYGGIETFLMNIIRKISCENKYEIVFLAFKKNKFDYEDEIWKRNCKIIRVATTRNPLRKYINLLNVMKKELPDVVHSNIAFENALVMKAAKKCGAKVRISHSHTTCPDKIGRKLYHKVLLSIMCHNATNLIACGIDAGKNLFRGCSDFEIVQNGINLDKFRFDEIVREKYRKEFGFSDGDIVIGHVGRLVDVKNHAYMLQILSKLDNKYKMVFVGDGELKQSLIEMAKDLSVNDRVLFLGNRDDTYNIYSMFDLFLFPSIYEGLGMALIEAQANGLSIIASSAVPFEAKINENFIFENVNIDTENWKELIEKNDMTRVVPSDKIQEYSIDKVVDRMSKIYDMGAQ